MSRAELFPSDEVQDFLNLCREATPGDYVYFYSDDPEGDESGPSYLDGPQLSQGKNLLSSRGYKVVADSTGWMVDYENDHDTILVKYNLHTIWVNEPGLESEFPEVSATIRQQLAASAALLFEDIAEEYDSDFSVRIDHDSRKGRFRVECDGTFRDITDRICEDDLNSIEICLAEAVKKATATLTYSEIEDLIGEDPSPYGSVCAGTGKSSCQ